jgi:hypothetical protein
MGADVAAARALVDGAAALAERLVELLRVTAVQHDTVSIAAGCRDWRSLARRGARCSSH